MNPTEQVRQDRALGIELRAPFESRLKLKRDTEVQVYLRNLAKTLEDKNPLLKDSAIGVLLIEDTRDRWYSYSLPGNRLYLSIGLIRQLSYENELAAVMAVEFGHLLKRHVIGRLIQGRDVLKEVAHSDSHSAYGDFAAPQTRDLPKSIEYFGPTGLFTYDEKYLKDAIDSAVEILYRAGYDPRGLVSLWELYQKHPDVSPYDPGTLDRILEYTREVISRYAPLLNPVVRSTSFLKVQKRIQKL